MDNLVDLFQWRAAKDGTRTAFTFLEDGSVHSTLTWAQLDAAARRVAVLLRAAQVSAGDRVLISYPPSLDSIVAITGALYAGAMAVPLPHGSPRRLASRFANVAADSQARHILAPGGMRDSFVSDTATRTAHLTWLSVEESQSVAAADWQEISPGGDSAAFLQYTSGSVGNPKACVITHRNVLCNEEAIRIAFEHDRHAVVVGWLPLHHDMGLFGNFLQPVFVGCSCVLFSATEFFEKPLRWLEAITRFSATTSGGPNFAYDLCARRIAPEQLGNLDLASWRLAFNGAEPVRADTMRRFARMFAPCGFQERAFYPCYGLAEATLLVTAGKLGRVPKVISVEAQALQLNQVSQVATAAAGAELVSCGAAGSGQRIAIVDPLRNTPSPQGTIGEIWVSGGNVANGYFGKQQETQETFHARIATEPERYLRTGDLGCMVDGELFVSGRLKDLIILRGRNYYPHDIERAAEQAHPSIRSGGCAAFSAPIQDMEQLVLVCEVEYRVRLDTAAITTAIRQAVADAADIGVNTIVLVRQGQVPKTTSGKTQRNACRRLFLDDKLARIDAQRSANAKARTGAASGVRGQVLHALAELTGRADESFPLSGSLPALGLDSLLMVRLAIRLEAQGLTVPLAVLHEVESLEQLIEHCEQLGHRDVRVEASTPSPKSQPLTSGQRSLWLHSQLFAESPAYNLCWAARLTGDIDVAALEAAFLATQLEHDALRMRVIIRAGEPWQHWDSRPVDLIRENARECSDAMLMERLASRASKPLDPQSAAPVDAVLYTQSDQRHVLLLRVHHIAMDLSGLPILLNGMQSRCIGPARIEAPQQRARFGSYVQGELDYLRSSDAEVDLAFWKGQLPDAASPRPASFVARTKRISERRTSSAADVAIPQEALRAFEQLGVETGCTPFELQLTVFALSMAYWIGRSHVVIGVPFAVRQGAELAHLVGYCVNLLPIRVVIGKAQTFRDLAMQVRRTVTAARQHSRLPLDVIAERLGAPREPGRVPFFDAVFVWRTLGIAAQNAWQSPGPMAGPLANAAVEILRLEEQGAQFDLAMVMTETTGGRSAKLVFDPEVLDAAEVNRAARRFAASIEAVSTHVDAKRAHVDAKVAELALLGAEERRTLIHEFAGPVRDYPQRATLASLFEQQMRRTPDAVALSGAMGGAMGGAVAGRPSQESWTYAQLEETSARLAQRLYHGSLTTREQVVGIAIERSAALIAAILAVTRAGACYLPLDLDDPDERLQKLLASSGCKVVLTGAPHSQRPAFAGVKVVDISAADTAITQALPEKAQCRADELAYVIHTSGSTGAPKGVMVEHRSVVNRLLWMAEALQLTAADVFIQKTPVTFDVSVWELFLPLLLGARLILLPRGGERDPQVMMDYCQRFDVTIAHFVPSMLLAFLGDLPGAARLPKWRYCICSGETLDANLRNRFYDVFDDVALVNLYGPTEAAIDVTWQRVGRDGASIPIGRPIANVAIRILDADDKLVPLGTPGELCVAGIQVARGYLNQPELTARVFGIDPIDGRSPLYRTGDLASWRSDGAIEYLGRRDVQVKIRGRRIELGEVESVLCEYPGVLGAAGAIRMDQHGSAELVAFLLCATLPPLEALLGYLKKRLPRALIPVAFAAVNELPLTSSGKLDRGRLPFSELERHREHYQQARTAEEQALSRLWAAELSLDRVGIDDNFFDLGGDSIRAVRVVAAARKSGIHFSVAELFRNPTVAGLVRHAQAGQEPPVPPVLKPFELCAGEWRALLPPDVEDAYPLSSVQQTLIFLAQTSAVYEIYVTTLQIRGRFHAATLCACLQRAVDRHSFLRASFDLVSFPEPIQRIHRTVAVPLAIVDWRHLPADQLEPQLQDWLRAERKRAFDYSAAPMLRVAVHLRSQSEFQFTLSDVSLDGWCVASLITEILEDYAAQLEGRPFSLPAPASTYADFVALEREALGDERSRDFWLDKMSRFEPGVLRRPAGSSLDAQRFQGRVTLACDDSLLAGLEALARRLSVPLKTLLLAAHAHVLSTLCGRNVVTGLEVNGRPEIEGGDRVIGVFNNTLPLCIDAREGSWLELIDTCWQVEREIMPFRRYPYQRLRKQLGGPLFDAVFVYTDFHIYRRISQAGAFEVLSAWASDQTFFALTAHFNKDVLSGKLQLLLDFDPAYWPQDAARALAESYRRSLTAMAAGPDALHTLRISRNPVIAHAEAERPRSASTVLSMLEAQVVRQPDRIAVICAGEHMTFRELWRRAGALASILRERGLQPEVTAGICMQRSIDLIVSLLAVWRAGAAFVALNPTDPPERQERILQDAGTVIVLTRRADARHFSTRTCCVDTLFPDGAAIDRVDLPVLSLDPANTAYVMYTSGSTGQPKGVVIQHDSLANYLAWAIDHYSLGGGGEVPVHTATSFDLTITSQIAPLVAGDTIHLLEDEDGAQALARMLSSGARPALVKLTPSHLEYLNRHVAMHGDLQAPCKAVVGGEALRAEQLRFWQARGTRLFNEYGPTEATVGCCVYEILANGPPQGAVPIGRPIRHTHIYVLDHWGQPLAPGLVGELWVAGQGLARGYCGNAVATAASFRPDPLARQPGRRRYRTGDLARLRPDGELEYLGRVDRQLKVRGFRIEPAEVEAALLSHPQVAAAAVSTRTSAAGSMQLAGYVIGRNRISPDPVQLRTYLATSLPAQLVPVTIAVLTEFPLNRNGKVDYQQLAASARQQGRQQLGALVERLEHASDEEVASMLSTATSEG